MVMSVNSQRSQGRILTQCNELHRVTSKENSAEVSSRALEIKLPQSATKVTRKTEHGMSRHRNNKVDGVH